MHTDARLVEASQSSQGLWAYLTSFFHSVYLQLRVSAAMGKRTKFQTRDIAQMVLHATPTRPSTQADAEATQQEAEGASPALPAAAVHSTDSVRLETIAFTEESEDPTCAVAKSEPLTPLEQSAILAQCLDICNNNPKDGLTSEEMLPYVERVLQTPANWMVYSTALLERSWLDFESHYGRERAVLQLQVRPTR